MAEVVIQGPIIQGWCPGALRPMASGDGLVVRVRPHGGRLSQAQARGIADLARRHGNGLIDLSNRANLQLRGVTEASYPALIAGLRQLGLIDDSAEAEARRKQHIIEIKEIKFRPGTDIHDYDVKMRSVLKFLEEGDKVKVTLLENIAEGPDADRIMNKTVAEGTNFLILGSFGYMNGGLKLAEQNGLSLDAYRFDTLDYFYALAGRAQITEAA